MSNTNNGLLTMLEEFGATLPAFAKQASIGDNVDDGTSKATEGSRSSENASDVKAQIVTNVDTAGTDTGPGGEKTKTNTIGTSKDETGVNVPGTKSSKLDSPTSHPAKANSESNRPHGGGGEKSAAQMGEMANDILALIAVATHEHEKLAAATPAEDPNTHKVENAGIRKLETEQAVKKIDPTEHETTKVASEDEKLGYDAARHLASQLLNKQAGANDQELMQKRAETECLAVIQRAAYHAGLVADHLSKFASDPTGGAPIDPATLAGDMGGAGAGAPADPMAAMGGGAPPAPPAGGDPAAAMGGGAPPAGADAAPGAGGIPPEVLQLAMALMQAGVTPQSITAGATGGGGSPMDAAATPPAGADSPAPVSPDVGAAAAAEDGSSDGDDKSGGKDDKGAEKEAAVKLASDPKFVGALVQALKATATKGK